MMLYMFEYMFIAVWLALLNYSTSTNTIALFDYRYHYCIMQRMLYLLI